MKKIKLSESPDEIDRLIIHICLNCNYNDGEILHIQKDYLRSAINSWILEIEQRN